MSIQDAVSHAYDVTIQRNWDTVYWCIDLHGTVIKSNYSNDSVEFIDDDWLIDALQQLSSFPETRIILWSSIFEMSPQEMLIRDLFNKHNIRIDYINQNPEVKNTQTGCFNQKFYFSVLIDDKAGFHPDEWFEVLQSAIDGHHRLLAHQQILGNTNEPQTA